MVGIASNDTSLKQGASPPRTVVFFFLFFFFKPSFAYMHVCPWDEGPIAGPVYKAHSHKTLQLMYAIEAFPNKCSKKNRSLSSSDKTAVGALLPWRK